MSTNDSKCPADNNILTRHCYMCSMTKEELRQAELNTDDYEASELYREHLRLCFQPET